MCFWRVVNGVKVDETFLHFECEMDFKKDSGKKHWFAQGFEATPEVHLDPPEIVKWKAEHPRE